MKYILQFSDWETFLSYPDMQNRECFTALRQNAKTFESVESANKYAEQNLKNPEHYTAIEQ